MKCSLKGHIVDDSFGVWLDEIGAPNISPSKVKQLVDQSNELNEPLEIDFSSGGGDVFAAGEICAVLTSAKNKTIGILSGLVASAATTIACVFNETKMYDYSSYMIHNPRLAVQQMVRPQEAKEIMDMLYTTTDNIVDIYKQRTSLTEDAIRSYMDNETFFTAKQAKELGFIDEVVPIVSNNIGDMPNISYQDVLANTSAEYKKFLNEFKGENSMSKNTDPKIEEPVAEPEKEPTTTSEEPTTTSEEPTTELVVETTTSEESATETVVETPTSEEPTLSDVMTAVNGLVSVVEKLTTLNVSAAASNTATALTAATPTDVTATAAVKPAEPSVTDVYFVDSNGKEKPQNKSRKLNALGLDVSNSII